jgi:hypothetical protein
MKFCGERFRLQFVGKLAELVGIDAKSKPERMRLRFWCRVSTCRSCFTKTSTDRTIDGFLERNAKFPRASLQQSRKIIVKRQCGSHAGIIDASKFDVKASFLV